VSVSSVNGGLPSSRLEDNLVSTFINYVKLLSELRPLQHLTALLAIYIIHSTFYLYLMAHIYYNWREAFCSCCLMKAVAPVDQEAYSDEEAINKRNKEGDT